MIEIKQTPEKQAEVLLHQVLDVKMEQLKQSREMQGKIYDAADKTFGARLQVVESLMRRTVALQEVLIDKGILTREEVDVKRNDLKPFWGEK